MQGNRSRTTSLEAFVETLRISVELGMISISAIEIDEVLWEPEEVIQEPLKI